MMICWIVNSYQCLCLLYMQISQECQLMNALASHSPEQVSLLKSRLRADRQPSELQNSSKYDCEEQVNQFKAQIQQKFKLSIANKIYTFPRKLSSLTDLISSCESEKSSFQQQISQKFEGFQPRNGKNKIKAKQLFKSDRQSTKKETITKDENFKPIAQKHKRQKAWLKSKSKQKSKQKLKNGKGSHKKSKSKDKQPTHIKYVVRGQKIRRQRLKTELSQSDLMDSIRQKFKRF